MSKREKKRPQKIADPESRPGARWPDLVIAVGLSIIVLLRPWRDGASFPGINAYFLWLTMALAAFWGARVLLRESAVRYARLSLPLVLFLLTALVTSFDTYNPDQTYRALLHWTAYLFLFVLAANTMRTPLSRGIFFSAFLVTMTASAVWALIHLHYVLPLVREAIAADPSARQYYFQTADLPAELAHRLSVNRAYGATLFPNALAALMILALPFLICELGAVAVQWRRVESDSSRDEGGSWAESALIGGSLTLALAGVARLLFPTLYSTVTGGMDWRSAGAIAAGVLYAAPIVIGAALALLVKLLGRYRAWLFVQLIFLPPAALAILWALIMTFSRGGMVALLAAGLAVGGLLVLNIRPRRPLTSAAVVGSIFVAVLLAAAAHAQGPELPAEGLETDVLSAESFLARLDYWHVGWLMIKDNFYGGVGLAGFGAAYGVYMFPGASTSQMAHNVLIQAFAETGVIGFVSILIFWTAYIAILSRAVLKASDSVSALRIAGPFAGVLAFFLHSLIDFNFSNPSLAMMAFTVAGASCARIGLQDSRSALANARAPIVGVSILLAVALVTAASIRIYYVDYVLTGPLPTARKLMLAGNRLEIRDKLFAGRFYLERLSAADKKPETILYGGYAELLRIIPSPDDIAEFGHLARLESGATNELTRLVPGDEVPPDSIVVITDVPKAKQALVRTAKVLLEDLEGIDRRYPYILELSMHAYEWCDLIYSHAPDAEIKREFALLGEKWARRCVERTPRYSASWLAYGRALWQRASTEKEPDAALKLYDEGLDAYRLSAEYFPSAPSGWENYATALEKLGESYTQRGSTEKAEALLEQARLARERVKSLQRQWAAAGT